MAHYDQFQFYPSQKKRLLHVSGNLKEDNAIGQIRDVPAFPRDVVKCVDL